MNFFESSGQVLCSSLSFFFILHERMKAPGRCTSRALSELAKYPTQCLQGTSRTPSIARHNSTSTVEHYNAFLRPLAIRQLISKQYIWSSKSHLNKSGGQISFAEARRHFSVSRISHHNDLVPPKPGEEYVKTRAFCRFMLIASKTSCHIC